jgi:hypothetical protein
MVDMQRLDEVMTHIHDYPEGWRQCAWGQQDASCGTTGCVAGWTGYLANGWEAAWWHGELTGFLGPDGKMWAVGMAARELLNLNEAEARVLFCGTNTMEDLDAMWKDFANHGTIRTSETTYFGAPYRSLSEGP